MQKKKTASAIGLVSSIFAMLIGGGMIMAPATADSSTSAGVTGAAVAEEQCGWRLANAPTSVTLTAAGEYELQDLEMTGSAAAVTAYSTGTDYSGDESGYSDCVMYGTTLSPSVSLAVSGTAVDAVHSTESGDTSMDFDFSSVGAFGVTATGSAGCTADTWTDVDSLTFTSTSAQDLMSLGVDLVDSNLDASDGEGNQVCAQDLVISLTVPGGKTPDDPGGTYTFQGFSLITELVQN